MRDAMTLLSDPAQGLIQEIRPSQIRMAEHVAHVLEHGGTAYVEAGVATGKTFAYLVPSLLAAGRRIVIATAKKQLQDQIISKDIPAIAQALGQDLQAALVDGEGRPQIVATSRKGNGNYTCRVLAEERTPGPNYVQFLSTSRHGDRADYEGAAPTWWPEASAEDCVGRKCLQAPDCGFMRMKKEMALSKIVVVNHHVLGVEMRFGLGKLVGGPYDVLIVDEAHKLAEGVRGAFTVRMSRKMVEQTSEQLRGTFSTFPQVAALAGPWGALFDQLPNSHWRDPHLREVPVFGENNAAMDGVFLALEDAWDEIDGTLERFGLGDNQDGNMADFSPDLQKDLSVMMRARRKIDDLTRGLQLTQGRVPRKKDEADEAYEQRKTKLLGSTAIYGSNEERFGFQLFCSPVRLNGIMKTFLDQVKTKVFTSATLAVNGSFAHLEDMTGVKPEITDILASPFDYDAQGFVYVPRDAAQVARTGRKDAPEADNRPYLDALQLRVDRAVRLVELSDGGAFVLTTANEELDAFARALKARFPGRAYAQGHKGNEWDGDPPSALEKFLGTKDSILIGSKSFWEGVDVVGGALRLVIVAKLPFPQVNDPIVKAREKLAANPFAEVQMADMLIDLRQGVGRLIRSRGDRGCVTILDNRVWTKRYGGAVLAALPWSRGLVTTDLAMCERYLPMFAKHFAKKVA